MRRSLQMFGVSSAFSFAISMLGLFELRAQPNDTIPCPMPWGPTTRVSHTTRDAFVPHLAIVGDTIHMVYYAGGCYYQRSNDKGETWVQETELVPLDSMSGIPGIAASGSYAYVVWENRLPTGFIDAVKIRRSTNSGRDWEEPVELFINSTSPGFGEPLVAVKSTQVYVTSTKPVGGVWHFFLIHSSDYGGHWDSIHQITSVEQSHASADIAASSSGLHLVCNRGIDFIHTMSTDFGVTWTREVYLSGIDPYRAWKPQVAVKNDSTIYTCWEDAKYGSSSGASGTVLLRRSTDGGVTWQAEVRVSVLPSAAKSSLSANGDVVHVVWDDERNGATRGSIQYNVSADGGATWCGETTVGDTLDFDIDASIGCSDRFAVVGWSSYPNHTPYHADVYSRVASWVVTGVPSTAIEPALTPVSTLTAFPNPFNSTTHLSISLPKHGPVVLEVVDIIGRRVNMLADCVLESGEHTFAWDATALSSGVYITRLLAGRTTVQAKLLLIR